MSENQRIMAVNLYLVGGAIRDKLLGVKSKDIDYAVEASSFEEMREYIASKGTIFLEKPEYFTIRAKIDNEDADFVLCRKEGIYSDGRRPDSVEIGDIYDDLSRRDFTVNAIALKKDTSNFIDPYNGFDDCFSKTLRCVGNPQERFREDSLRLLRAIRFAITKGFSIDSSIHECLKDKSLVSLLGNVSKDRIRDEMNKCFKFDTQETLGYIQKYCILEDMILGDKYFHLELSNKS